MSSDKKSVQIRGIPVDLWRRAKVVAAQRGITVRELIIELLKSLR
ncbi:MAG: hypothetical protein V3S39_00065 [Thermodesulfobacteriota bacterium]